MNDVQQKISELQDKGWTLAALADEFGVTVNAVEKWKAGETRPRMSRVVLTLMDEMLKRKPPKKRRYPGTHHLQRRKSEN